MMKRKVLDNLIHWKDDPNRKPLILKGLRQTGKTYILKHFGETRFPACHYFNFEEGGSIHTIFNQDLVPARIISELSLLQGRSINIEEDLVIFDEIQECPRALTSLKYFCEKLPILHICCAGSLLGIQTGEGSFPVGKVNFLNLYPLSFEEFLWTDGNAPLIEAFYQGLETREVPSVAHDLLLDKLYHYYVTGGMPAAVNRYLELGQEINQQGLESVRSVLTDLITMYESDVAKHAGKLNSIHITSVFHSIPNQLAEVQDLSTRRYRFKDVIPGKKGFAALEGPIHWLTRAALIHKVSLVERSEMPFEAFTSYNMFKLFLADTGILGAMLDLPPASLLKQDYGMAKGFFAENFVLQELIAAGMKPVSWKERNSEIEFLFQDRHGAIIPVEVKSGRRVKAKSLKQYIQKYAPGRAVIISGNSLHADPGERIARIPLYYAGFLPELLG